MRRIPIISGREWFLTYSAPISRDRIRSKLIRLHGSIKKIVIGHVTDRTGTQYCHIYVKFNTAIRRAHKRWADIDGYRPRIIKAPSYKPYKYRIIEHIMAADRQYHSEGISPVRSSRDLTSIIWN